MLLDFTRVGYINSTGIALIVGLLARARKRGQDVRACGLAEHYREIFEITRLSDFMTILDGRARKRRTTTRTDSGGGGATSQAGLQRDRARRGGDAASEDALLDAYTAPRRARRGPSCSTSAGSST